MDYRDFESIAKHADAALRQMGNAVEASGLDKTLTELVKLRASQINGCAFCLDLHLDWARKAGVSDRKIDLLPVWHEADVFSPAERAALSLTEALTRIEAGGPAAENITELGRHFSRSEIVFLTIAIANINAWNRIAGPLRFSLPNSRSRAA